MDDIAGNVSQRFHSRNKDGYGAHCQVSRRENAVDVVARHITETIDGCVGLLSCDGEAAEQNLRPWKIQTN